MSISHIVIRTFIEQSLRAAVDAGLAAVLRGSSGERRAASGERASRRVPCARPASPGGAY